MSDVFDSKVPDRDVTAPRDKGAWKPVPARRTCLRCGKKFKSAHSGNRFCNYCITKKIHMKHDGFV